MVSGASAIARDLTVVAAAAAATAVAVAGVVPAAAVATAVVAAVVAVAVAVLAAGGSGCRAEPRGLMERSPSSGRHQ